jgi:hypothetical protein
MRIKKLKGVAPTPPQPKQWKPVQAGADIERRGFRFRVERAQPF